MKDASGNPIPEALLVPLTRGDGNDRRGEVHHQRRRRYKRIVTPVVTIWRIAGPTNTKMSQTGTDGNLRIINVTRPTLHGTRTAINATLYENAAVQRQYRHYFLPLSPARTSTSPVCGAYGAVVNGGGLARYINARCLMLNCRASNIIHYQEDNEEWAAFYGPGTKTNPSQLRYRLFPSVEC